MHRVAARLSRLSTGLPANVLAPFLSDLAYRAVGDLPSNIALPVGYASWGRSVFCLTGAAYGQVDWRQRVEEEARISRMRDLVLKHWRKQERYDSLPPLDFYLQKRSGMMREVVQWAAAYHAVAEALLRAAQLGHIKVMCLLDDGSLVQIAPEAWADELNWESVLDTGRIDPWHKTRRHGRVVFRQSSLDRLCARLKALKQDALRLLQEPPNIREFLKPYLDKIGRLSWPMARAAARTLLGPNASKEAVERKAGSLRSGVYNRSRQLERKIGN